MEKKIWLEFDSSTNDVISNIIAKNETFDACTIWVLYHGENRNRTSISKEAVEAALESLPYCPIVCHYIADEDRIGGHDVAFVKSPDGAVRMVNLTEPVGVIPNGAQYHWEKRTDGNAEHEYLVVDGLLWKRSAAYEKLKRDGASGQSMEITVKDGKQVDGVFQIYDFLFTAFCILGEDVEPCFESASLETFSLGDYKARFENMMDDLKKEPPVITAAPEDDDRTFSLKGGEGKVNLDEMMAKYGLVQEDITFDLEGLDQEAIEQKFAEIHDLKYADGDPASENEEPADPVTDNPVTDNPVTDNPVTDNPVTDNPVTDNPVTDNPVTDNPGTDETNTDNPNTDEEDDASDPAGKTARRNDNFALMAGQIQEELSRALSQEMYHSAFWDADMRRYWLIDFDHEAMTVFADDQMNRVICGFSYSMNGDKPVIDFASYKRKKVQFVDFDEGDPVVALFGDRDAELQEVFSKRLEAATAEVEELRKFHDETVAAQRRAQVEEVFASFADLAGNESFEALKGNYGELSVDEISEKCFAIRGRNMKVNFSANASNPSAAVRLPVDRAAAVDNNEPYNGVFARYGYGR